MDQQELNNLVEIIKTKIYNESISFQEIITSFYGKSEKFEVDINTVSDNDIKDNIINNKDMNVIGNKTIMIPTDLNAFLQSLLEARKNDRLINEEYLKSFSPYELAFFISNYLLYHTNQENLEMKKIFLKRMGLFHPKLDEHQLEVLFFDTFSIFYETETQKQGR